jgi:hypothetical protein
MFDIQSHNSVINNNVLVSISSDLSIIVLTAMNLSSRIAALQNTDLSVNIE